MGNMNDLIESKRIKTISQVRMMAFPVVVVFALLVYTYRVNYFDLRLPSLKKQTEKHDNSIIGDNPTISNVGNYNSCGDHQIITTKM